MSGLKQRVIDEVIKVEGGFVDNKDDSGGKTNFGITEKVARANGYTGEMRDMQREFAVKVYEKLYWDKMRGDDIEHIMALDDVVVEMFDTAVNIGVGRAVSFLQRSLNVLNNRGKYYQDVVVDGIIGNKTLTALSAYRNKRGIQGERMLKEMMNCLQGAFYVELSERREKDEEFVYGWFLKRVI